MGTRDELIARYADDLRNKCGIEPDMDLLAKVATACGPALCKTGSGPVAAAQPAEIETVRKTFLIGRLGLVDNAALTDAIKQVLETYGRTERTKHRAVVCYMLTKYFGKESVFG